MGDLFPLPAELQQVEYAQLYFHLEISSAFELPPLGLLQLRRELVQAAGRLHQAGAAGAAQIKTLLQPPIADDPLLRKQFKKPAPGFVLRPDPARQGVCESKQRIILPVLLLGNAVGRLQYLLTLFEELGQQGLYHGDGQFRLAAVETEDGGGRRMTLWHEAEEKIDLQLQINDLYWWLLRQPLLGTAVEIEFVSPLRLLRHGKPLFQVDFADFFPYLLRRVTSVLACHAGIEPVGDSAGLIELAGRIANLSNRLRWFDWRRLTGEARQQDLGGLLGTLRIAGPELAEIAWLLQLGQLFQVGKSATYGAGQYHLRTL